MVKVSPSILSCDFASLKADIDTIIKDVDYLHIDVMDGDFVNNISFGIPIVKCLRPHYDILFDTHLMISHPYKYLEAFKKAGSDLITFHLEVQDDPKQIIKKTHELGMKCGISVKPKTDVRELKPYLGMVDLVLVMSVEPGFGGQSFDPSALEKIEWLNKERKKYAYHYEIEVDGGINDITGGMCITCGADVLVSGSYIFASADRKKAIASLK